MENPRKFVDHQYELIPNISLMPSIYKRISLLFPDKPWLTLVKKIKQTEKQFPFSMGQAQIDNWLAFALTSWEDQNFDVASNHEWHSLVKTMSLADHVSSLCENVRAGRDGPKELENRFRGCIQNPDDARAIYLELHLAKILAGRGCSITWPVENEGNETFDLLVRPPKGLPEFELECKSFSGDKGALAGLSDGQRLIEACVKTTTVGELFPKCPDKASILTIEIFDEIPKDIIKLACLAKDIIATLNGEPPPSLAIFKIVHNFADLIGNNEDPDSCFNAAMGLPAPTLAIAICSSQEMGWQALRVAWTGKITLWKKAEDIAKSALRKQLTATRPGGLVLQFVNDTVEKIVTVNDLENKYRKLSNKLFTRSHAALVVIASDIDVRPVHIQSPYARNAFMGEFVKTAAFDNPGGTYPNSRLKLLFA